MKTPKKIPEKILEKIRPFWGEFSSKGWTKENLVGRSSDKHVHHGLAWYLQKKHDIGRIWEYCVELLGGRSGSGERTISHYWKDAPLMTLIENVGSHVIPSEIRGIKSWQ